jgi:hypothetical protein
METPVCIAFGAPWLTAKVTVTKKKNGFHVWNEIL